MIPECEDLKNDFYCAEQDVDEYTIPPIECTGKTLCCFWCKDLGTCPVPCLTCKPYISEKTKNRELATVKKTVGLIPCEEGECVE